MCITIYKSYIRTYKDQCTSSRASTVEPASETKSNSLSFISLNVTCTTMFQCLSVSCFFSVSVAKMCVHWTTWSSNHSVFVVSLSSLHYFHPHLSVDMRRLTLSRTSSVGCEKPPGRLVASPVFTSVFSSTPHQPPHPNGPPSSLQMPLPSAC